MSKTHFPRVGGQQWVNSSYESPVTTGNVIYVNSVTGTSSGPGFSPETAYSTIDAAIGACTANNGDIIVVMPGHAETVTGDIDVDVAGIWIMGTGVGETRPVVTFATNTTAKVDVDAANCKISNIVFKNNIDSQAIVVDVDGAGFVIEDCDFLEGSSKQYLIGVDLAEDRGVVRRCNFSSVSAGADSAVKISAAKDRIVIEDNVVYGDFSDACIHNPTGNVATNVVIRNNVLTNLQTGDHAIELVSACTGVISRNVVNSTLAAVATKTSVDPGSCYCIENYGSDGVGDVSGVLNPVADA
jgi:hypothetical protein